MEQRDAAEDAAEAGAELTAEEFLQSDVQLWEQLLLGGFDGNSIANTLSLAMEHPSAEQQQQQQQRPAEMIDLTVDDNYGNSSASGAGYGNGYGYGHDNGYGNGYVAPSSQHSYQHQYQHQYQHEHHHQREWSQRVKAEMNRQPSTSRLQPEHATGQPAYTASYSSYFPTQPMYYRRMEVFFRLLSLTHFTIAARPKERMKELLSTLKLIPGAHFDEKIRKWKIPINLLGVVETAIAENCKFVNIHSVPQEILRMRTLATQRMNADENAGNAEQFLQERVHARLLRALAPFQREGVAFIVKRGGRALLADEMGLGKTIQGLAAACAYQTDWPVLIICPSSARYHWRNEIVQWCTPELADLSDVVVINSGNQQVPRQKKFYVVSYGLVTTMSARLSELRCQTIIADECHYLKNLRAKRTKVIVPMLRHAERAILLSGTPALSRPYELFPQLHAIDSQSWPDQKEFGRRYCRNKRKRSGAGEFRGATNVSELHALLKGTLMIRRRKRDILKELPPKVRHFEHAELKDEMVRDELRGLLNQVHLAEVELANRKQTMTREDKAELRQERKSALLSLFMKSGAAKLPLTLDWLKRRLDDITSGKVLMFGHHRQVLNGIQTYLVSRGVEFIRIDGSTPPNERQARADRFQTSSNCRVAILGIAAAGIALTLTAASTVFFAELFWTPGALVQAEDRAHRIGQTSEVHVTYLLAKDTVDDVLWPLVQKKMQTLGEIVEGEQNVGMGNGDALISTQSSSSSSREAAGSPSNNIEELVEELAAEDQVEQAVAADNEDEDDEETKGNSDSAAKEDDEDAQEWHEDAVDEDDDLADVSVQQQRSQSAPEIVDLLSDDENDEEQAPAAPGSDADGQDRKRQYLGAGGVASNGIGFEYHEASRGTSSFTTASCAPPASAYSLALPPMLPQVSASSEVDVIDDGL